MSDLIERQAAIDSIGKCTDIYVNNLSTMVDKAEAYQALNDLPSAEPEPFIPVSWIEKHVDWLKNMDNEFANLTAMNISTMVKKWKKEQEETDESDKQTGCD